MELIPIPLVEGALSLSEIRGSYVPGWSLGSLFTDEWGWNPTWIVVWPGFSVLMGGARFSQNGHLQRNAHWWIFPSTLLPMSFPHKSHSPLLSQRSSNNHSQVWPRFPWRPCLALGPSACKNLCVPSKNGVSASPSPRELLHTSRTGLQWQILLGLFLPVPDPHTWGFDVGLRTLTPVGESLWYSYFPVCESSHLGGMGLLISHNCPSYLLMCPPLCLLEKDIFLKVSHPFGWRLLSI